MRNNEVWIIVKKELIKFFGNKRVLFSTAILPGLVIFCVYSMMGKLMHKQENDAYNFNSAVFTINMPENISSLMEMVEIHYKEIPVSQKESVMKKIKEKNEVLLIHFPEKFNELCGVRGKYPNVEIYYNASYTESNNYYTYILAMFENYENGIVNLFNINEGDRQYNLASDDESIAKSLSTLLPVIIMGLLFSACLSVAAESIAGEKERGTLATLLATPVKRCNIALAKVIALSIIALCSGTSSYLGVIFALPALLNMKTKQIFEIYGVNSYILLFFTLLSVIFLVIAIMSLCSAYARTIKEANTALSPFAAGAMLIGMTCMIQNKPVTNLWVYIIPFYNNVQELYSILNFEINYVSFIVMFISNLLYTVLCVMFLTKMFKSEKVMFS